MTSTDARRRIPSVGGLLTEEPVRALIETYSRPAVVAVLRDLLAEVRDDPNSSLSTRDARALAEVVRERISEDFHPRDEPEPSLRPVVNATGVVLHTNLGRAPLADGAIRAMSRVAKGYSNLEFDLGTGRRGSRHEHCRDMLCRVTGAEDALVVNNNAAAMVLAVNEFASDREVVVSRGEIVEIGGGFRIPEMLERAGARLREVGTTNRTREGDYRTAIAQGEAGLVLKVHHSNFEIRGFTEAVGVAQLVPIVREAGIPLLYDLGSGLLSAPVPALADEPTPASALASGVDLVAFSGDKLLGGPQAGILVGGSEWVERLRRNPLCRALRVDKGTLAALHETLRVHLLELEHGVPASTSIPVLEMVARSESELRKRVEAWVDRLSPFLHAAAIPSVSLVGGGCSPNVELSSYALSIRCGDPDGLARRLREGTPSIVPRVEGGSVLFDARTVDPRDEDTLLAGIQRAYTAEHSE